MKIQVLISTINNSLNHIDEGTKKYPFLTVINQKPSQMRSRIEETVMNGVHWVDFNEKGLSKSRNLAIDLADADAVYLTDDDIVLEEDFYPLVADALEQNPDYDILAFNVKGIEKEFKKEVTEEKDINFLTSMRLSSVQIIYRYDFIKNNNLRFDEYFGAGSDYMMGEENIFLFDALKSGAKIKFIPKTIAKLHIGESSWFEGMNKKYLFDRGASYWRMFGLLAPLYSLTFVVRKRREYKEYTDIFNAYWCMIRGMKDYIEKNKKNEQNS